MRIPAWPVAAATKTVAGSLRLPKLNPGEEGEGSGTNDLTSGNLVKSNVKGVGTSGALARGEKRGGLLGSLRLLIGVMDEKRNTELEEVSVAGVGAIAGSQGAEISSDPCTAQ